MTRDTGPKHDRVLTTLAHVKLAAREHGPRAGRYLSGALALMLFGGGAWWTHNRINSSDATPLTYSKLLEQAETIDNATIHPDGVVTGGFRNSNKTFITSVNKNDPTLSAKLHAAGVKVTVKPEPLFNNDFIRALMLLGGAVLGLGFLLRYRKPKWARIDRGMRLMKDQDKARFSDLGGADEAVRDAREIINIVKDPECYRRMGGDVPQGVLFIGPPGTGKTLCARAMAGEAGVPFFHLSGAVVASLEAEGIQEIWKNARKQRCILFIDEFEAAARARQSASGMSSSREDCTNQLLHEMSQTNEGIILVAATNRPDLIDPAMLRRFDRKVLFANPNIKGRMEILGIHIKKREDMLVSGRVNLQTIAQGTPGFSGADLKNLVNEAALAAAKRIRAAEESIKKRRRKKEIGREERKTCMADFVDAQEKIMLGGRRTSVVTTPTESLKRAYHEAGHILTALYTQDDDTQGDDRRLHKSTLVPYGDALGLTLSLAIEDRRIFPRSYYTALLVQAYGGRAAEIIKFGESSSGALRDIQQGTGFAYQMVTQLGMKYFDKEDESPVCLDYGDTTNPASWTSSMSGAAYEYVVSLVRAAQKKSMQIVQEHLVELEALAKALMDYETLSGKDIMAVRHAVKDIAKKVAGEARPLDIKRSITLSKETMGAIDEAVKKAMKRRPRVRRMRVANDITTAIATPAAA
ncbi:MAG: AAA family ATPase [Proteobacteria bacterium]|nr:AAA family ATPase [Pseudomonadota bacterium]